MDRKERGKTRYKRLRESGLCTSCGKHNPTPERSMCPECRERKNANRRDNNSYFKRIGMCCRCHNNPAEPNKVLCAECAESDRLYSKQYHATEQSKQRSKEQKQLLKVERLSNNLCPKCGKRKAYKGGLCIYCRGYLKRYRSKNQTGIDRSEWIAFGKCYCCGSESLLSGKKVCASCYDTRLKTLPSMWSHLNNEYWRNTNTFKRSISHGETSGVCSS